MKTVKALAEMVAVVVWTYWTCLLLSVRWTTWAKQGRLTWGEVTVAFVVWKEAAASIPPGWAPARDYHREWLIASEWGVKAGVSNFVQGMGREDTLTLRALQRAMDLADARGAILSVEELDRLVGW